MEAFARLVPGVPMDRGAVGPRILAGLLAALVLTVLLFQARAGLPPAGGGEVAVTGEESLGIQNDYASLPLAFEPNRGQSESSADFLSRGAGYAVAVAPDGARLEV